MAAAAMAPLLIGAQAAHAQLTINNDTSTPVQTATAVNGGPGDINVTGGTFTIKDTTPAITLNSNNSVTTSSAIVSSNVNNVTGILVGAGGPYTGTIENSGTISLSESYTPSDSANSDGITEAPYASPGSTGRIAIRVVGQFTGLIDNTGAITIQGNNSAGISIENLVTGPVEVSGSITVTGDNSYGIHTTGEITSDLNVSAAVTMKGQNSVGVQTTAPVDGTFVVYNTVTTTGYAITTRETGQILTNIEKTPTDVEQGGSAIMIGGNVGGGIFLGAPPTGTVSTDTTTDADGDGLVDSQEGTSALITYGSAPALQIGGTSPITIGNFTSANTVNTSYGLIVEGAITSNGVYDGVSSTAVAIGGAGVNLSGGIHVTNSSAITATSFQADATAINIGTGVTAQAIVNEGVIESSVTSASANTSSAIIIGAGSTVTSLTNVGTIEALVTGDSANAIAVADHGGGITTVYNSGGIIANPTPALAGEIVTGKGIALDLSANTSGVTLVQTQNPETTTAPAITGDVLLGTGQNSVSILAGTVTGTLNMQGAAGDSLTIDNGGVYVGNLLYSGAGLAINLANGSLIDNSPTTINASSLTVGATSTLAVNLDPVHNANTYFNVSGAATFAPGAQIAATLSSAPPITGQTFVIVRSPSLSTGNLGSTLLDLPYLFNGSLSSTANTIAITVSTKTPAQMSMNKSETSAFNAIYADLPQDSAANGGAPSIQTALIGAIDRPTFIGAYDQLLPDSNGDVFNTALGMSKAVSRATSDRFDLSTQKDDEDEDDFIVSGFWASEFYSGMDQNKVDNTAYHSAALGVIGGYDFGGTGFTIAAGSSNITRPHSAGDSLNAVSTVELGAYAAPRFGALNIDARIGAGWLNVSSRREFVAQVVSGDLSNTSTIERTAKGDWSGYDLSAHLGAGLQFDVSKHLFFQPKVYADVFHMSEQAYNERNGGATYDLDVAARQSTQTNGTASVVTGLRFGNQFVFSPQVEVGYDKVITGGPADTTARFAYGGPSFTVVPNQISGAAVGRLTLRGDGNYVHFSLQAGGEYSKDFHSMDMKANFRLTF
jgi:Autotransporter beta-domain